MIVVLYKYVCVFDVEGFNSIEAFYDHEVNSRVVILSERLRCNHV